MGKRGFYFYGFTLVCFLSRLPIYQWFPFPFSLNQHIPQYGLFVFDHSHIALFSMRVYREQSYPRQSTRLSRRIPHNLFQPQYLHMRMLYKSTNIFQLTL